MVIPVDGNWSFFEKEKYCICVGQGAGLHIYSVCCYSSHIIAEFFFISQGKKEVVASCKLPYYPKNPLHCDDVAHNITKRLIPVVFARALRDTRLSVRKRKYIAYLFYRFVSENSFIDRSLVKRIFHLYKKYLST